MKNHEIFFNPNFFKTYIGDVLIAVNPFKQLNIYEKEQHKAYSRVQFRSVLRPHVFWVADAAYQRMLIHKTTQCIAVSGESGAGIESCFSIRRGNSCPSRAWQSAGRRRSCQ